MHVCTDRIFFLNVFDLQLVESTYLQPFITEGQLYPFMQEQNLRVVSISIAISCLTQSINKSYQFYFLIYLPFSLCVATACLSFHLDNYNSLLIYVIISSFFFLPILHSVTKTHTESCCIPFLHTHLLFLPDIHKTFISFMYIK